MKQIVWLCNVPTPKASEAFGWNITNVGGWMFWLSEKLGQTKNFKLNLIFETNKVDKVTIKEYEGIKYYAIPNLTRNAAKYNKKIQIIFKDLLAKINPDIIHIFGTEYSHTLAMVNACIDLKIIDRCVISIQGLADLCSKYYYGNLNEKEKKTVTLRDLIKLDTLSIQKRKLQKRGVYEKEAIKKVSNIIGRTEWDKALTKQINQNVTYYCNNENLRESFYNNEWSYDKCIKHSIFLSQGYYPLKGLDVILKALPEVLKWYPDTKVYVSGYYNTSKIKRRSYEQIIKKIIQKNKLEHHIEFIGTKNEEEMVKEYLKANLFVCPSAIENSSNSLGEAMILGTPVIASYVGGTPNLLKDKEEGYLFQANADYMLAYYIKDLFDHVDKSIYFSKNARQHALKTHNREINFIELKSIYEDIMRKCKILQ